MTVWQRMFATGRKKKARSNRLRFKRLIREGRVSLVIGSLFLAACLLTSQLLLRGREPETLVVALREGLTIAGWVALWRPMQIFLYEWWPLLRPARLYEKMSRIKVEVRRPASG